MNTEVITNKILKVFNSCPYAWMGKMSSEAKEIKSILDEALNMRSVVGQSEQYCECDKPTLGDNTWTCGCGKWFKKKDK